MPALGVTMEPTMSKPVVKIRNAYIIGGHLWGEPMNYPDEHQCFPGAVTNNEQVRTSAIISHEGMRVETERTVYDVINWVVMK